MEEDGELSEVGRREVVAFQKMPKRRFGLEPAVLVKIPSSVPFVRRSAWKGMSAAPSSLDLSLARA